MKVLGSAVGALDTHIGVTAVALQALGFLRALATAADNRVGGEHVGHGTAIQSVLLCFVCGPLHCSWRYLPSTDNEDECLCCLFCGVVLGPAGSPNAGAGQRCGSDGRTSKCCQRC